MLLILRVSTRRSSSPSSTRRQGRPTATPGLHTLDRPGLLLCGPFPSWFRSDTLAHDSGLPEWFPGPA